MLGVDKFGSKLNRNITEKKSDIIHNFAKYWFFINAFLFSVKKFNINCKIGENHKKEVYNCGISCNYEQTKSKNKI